jgi:DNA-binding transcriptional LysR family regulator
MEMHQVRYFLAVARTLSFTQAAEECHVAQPSLSRAIIKLEEELGGDLFRRERRLTHLTELGRMMLPLLTQCYESANAAKQLATSYKKGKCAPLRVGLSHTVNMQIVIQPLSELMRAFPGLELKFFRGTAGEVGAELKSGAIEAAIACPLPEDWERLESWDLFTERFELAMHTKHTLAMHNAVSLEHVAKWRLLRRPYCEHAAALDDVLAVRGIRLEFQDQIGSDHDLLPLLGANVGISIMPQSAKSGDALHFIAIEDLALTRTVKVYAVAGRERSPAANGLLRLLRSADWSQLLSFTPEPMKPSSVDVAKSAPPAQVQCAGVA